jgi:hypothetical protein
MDTQGLLQTVRWRAACGGSASKNARIGAFRARKPTIRVCTHILIICAHCLTPCAKLIDTDFFRRYFDILEKRKALPVWDYRDRVRSAYSCAFHICSPDWRAAVCGIDQFSSFTNARLGRRDGLGKDNSGNSHSLFIFVRPSHVCAPRRRNDSSQIPQFVCDAGYTTGNKVVGCTQVRFPAPPRPIPSHARALSPLLA